MATMNYNQQFTQKEFSVDYDQSDWESDCATCAAATNPSATDHSCFMCAEFSPTVYTFEWFNFINLLIIVVILPIFIISLFKKRKYK